MVAIPYRNVTGQGIAPLDLGADPFVVLPGSHIEVGRGGRVYETLGAVGSSAPPLSPNGVRTLMHVGHDGLGDLGPDLSGTARTVGWVSAGVWGYAKYVKKDKALAEKALYAAIGSWIASFLL